MHVGDELVDLLFGDRVVERGADAADGAANKSQPRNLEYKVGAALPVPFEPLHALCLGPREEARLRALTNHIEHYVHPARAAGLHMAAQYALRLARAQRGVHLRLLALIDLRIVLHAAECRAAAQHEARHVKRKHGRGVRHAELLRKGRVRERVRDWCAAETRGGVDVDDAVLPHDRDGEPRGPDVLLRARVHDRVVREARDRARHERRRVVAHEREQPVAGEEVKREGRGVRGGRWRTASPRRSRSRSSR